MGGEISLTPIIADLLFKIKKDELFIEVFNIKQIKLEDVVHEFKNFFKTLLISPKSYSKLEVREAV